MSSPFWHDIIFKRCFHKVPLESVHRIEKSCGPGGEVWQRRAQRSFPARFSTEWEEETIERNQFWKPSLAAFWWRPRPFKRFSKHLYFNSQFGVLRNTKHETNRIIQTFCFDFSNQKFQFRGNASNVVMEISQSTRIRIRLKILRAHMIGAGGFTFQLD